MRKRHLLFVVPRLRQLDFDQLMEAWDGHGIRVTTVAHHGAIPDVRDLMVSAGEVDAVLLAGSGRRAPSTVLPGPFLTDPKGRRVPAAWLPLRSSDENRRFAASAARVHQRARGRIAVALLGQWHPRYLRTTDRIETLLRPHVRTVRWTADVIGREEMVSALGGGLGVALYLGHGRAMGWVGYHGVRRHHFTAGNGEPLGALLSLCCRTASRRRVGLSYAEAIPLLGVAASSFGAVSDTLHTDNTRWALGLCDALAAGAATIGELIALAAPSSPAACAPFRLIGDPLAPLASEHGAVDRADAVPTYP